MLVDQALQHRITELAVAVEVVEYTLAPRLTEELEPLGMVDNF
jgi:hypothetical protein